jgi:hypothetical protein
VVVRIDEALEQLEPPGGLGPPAWLDLLSDLAFVALVDQTSIELMPVKGRSRSA